MAVTPQQQIAQLEHQLTVASTQNQQLQQEIDRLRRQREVAAQAGTAVAVTGGRLLVPLFDRYHVVRTFAKFAETVSDFSGPTNGWPSKDQIVRDAREFLQACVRFTIRRRLFVLFFSLIATAVPAIQVWLVVQQNEIIGNQAKFQEIQVYDIVSRSMTEGDRNARLMTGALLSRVDLEFLEGVVNEAFDERLGGMRSERSIAAKPEVVRLRFEDAAFRGALARAVLRGVELRRDAANDAELFEQVRPMFVRILEDATDRVPALMRLGAQPGVDDASLLEQVDNYVTQVVEVMKVYGRLARSSGRQPEYFADLKPLLRRFAKIDEGRSRSFEAYGFALEELMYEVAMQRDLKQPPPDLDQAGLTPEQARSRGLESLRTGLGEEGIDWNGLAAQLPK